MMSNSVRGPSIGGAPSLQRTLSEPLAASAPAGDAVAWRCGGCGRLTADLKGDIEKIRSGGFLSCCPERNMEPLYAGPSEPSPSSRSETAGPPRWPRAGDRMTFLGENGYDYELQAAMKIFEVGAEYIVRGCDVGDWRHTISFEGKPGHFNGVMFARIAPDCSGCKPGGVQESACIEGAVTAEGAATKSGGEA